jgi:microcystin-dependent protein
MAEPFIGEIRMFGGNFAPRGWAFCNGQLLSIAQNTALFSLLGTTYGGNGQTTFGLPNLQGRFPMHWGNGAGLTPRQIGEISGTESETLNLSQIPAHAHAASGTPRAVAAKGNSNMAQGNVWSKDAGVQSATYSSGAPDTNMRADAVLVAVQPAGGSQPHNNVPPFQCVSFIIALEGIFPSRS